jgi:hypothetical protein
MFKHALLNKFVEVPQRHYLMLLLLTHTLAARFSVASQAHKISKDSMYFACFPCLKGYDGGSVVDRFEVEG